MSYLVAAPEFLASAATDLSNIGSAVTAAHAAAAAPTTEVLAAGADEVSAAVASLFAGHGQAFQALSAQAAAYHAQFVQALNAARGAYTAAEAANAAPLQPLQSLSQAASAPAQTLADLLLPNTALSVSGVTLLQTGSAHASSGLGGVALTVGANSNATANTVTPGILSFATAIGNNDTAITNGSLSTATVLGNNSDATAGFGAIGNTAFTVGNSGSTSAGLSNHDYFNLALVTGSSTAIAGSGSGNAAVVFGNGNLATAGFMPGGGTGNFDIAAVLSANNSGAASCDGNGNIAAILSGTNNFAGSGFGNANIATVTGGTGNIANAGPDNANVATVATVLGLGNNLTANAMGNGVTSIVTPFGSL